MLADDGVLLVLFSGDRQEPDEASLTTAPVRRGKLEILAAEGITSFAACSKAVQQTNLMESRNFASCFGFLYEKQSTHVSIYLG